MVYTCGLPLEGDHQRAVPAVSTETGIGWAWENESHGEISGLFRKLIEVYTKRDGSTFTFDGVQLSLSS
mgnify:CR=1 FL=1